MEWVCWFILEDIFSWYKSIEKMRADKRELDIIEGNFSIDIEFN